MSDGARVACRTPNPGKRGATNIPVWKFDLLRGAIRRVLGRGDASFRDLPELVRAELSEDQLAGLGSVGWHVTTVKLELEVRGEIGRVPGKGLQRLRLNN